jgi:hypothetical protein
MKPLDERLRNLKLIRPPALFSMLDRYSDEVTSLLIQRDNLLKANAEMVDQLNSLYWVREREHMDVPF